MPNYDQHIPQVNRDNIELFIAEQQMCNELNPSPWLNDPRIRFNLDGKYIDCRWDQQLGKIFSLFSTAEFKHTPCIMTTTTLSSEGIIDELKLSSTNSRWTTGSENVSTSGSAGQSPPIWNITVPTQTSPDMSLSHSFPSLTQIISDTAGATTTEYTPYIISEAEELSLGGATSNCNQYGDETSMDAYSHPPEENEHGSLQDGLWDWNSLLQSAETLNTDAPSIPTTIYPRHHRVSPELVETPNLAVMKTFENCQYECGTSVVLTDKEITEMLDKMVEGDVGDAETELHTQEDREDPCDGQKIAIPNEAYSLGELIEQSGSEISMLATKCLGKYWRKVALTVYYYNEGRSKWNETLTPRDYYNMKIGKGKRRQRRTEI
ncbi:5302_t:CDS:2 [Paraglomus occultum]|uniref:5302_t:CDS:1 n=1 Tax=Paraglomus occultum TaxID=144539 RepID=A0A9N9DKP5_9GLOM|nr:5302_t:CDS:2 [Paraglomus occultum]